MTSKPFSTPSNVDAEEGEVVVDGPNGVAISFTPDAAIETSDRLRSASDTARGQLKQAEPEPAPGEDETSED
jgi:hypothetical protein